MLRGRKDSKLDQIIIMMTLFARLPLKVLSVLMLSTAILTTSPAVLAQSQEFPELQDRTGDLLIGLPNDASAKIVELGDFNNDGREDLVISRTGAEPVLLMNIGGTLTNDTALMFPSAASANDALYVEAFDADGDGWTDLVFGRRTIEPILYRNLAIDSNGVWLGFDNGTAILGTTNNLVLEAGDVNGDGSQDLFAIRVERNTNDLLINDGNGNFTVESDRLGGLGDLTRGHSALLADVEGDGDVDVVYIESDLFLYIYYNDGNANFDNTRRSTFTNPDNFAYIFGAGDFNGDGIFDYRQYSNPAPMAEMSDGTFDSNGLPNYTVRTEANMLRGNRKHGTVHIRDIDSDGDLDYVLSSMLRNFGGLRNTTEGMRTEMVFNTGINSGEFVSFVGVDWGNEESYDMKILDINGDGSMDMFVAHQFRYGVYLNNPPEAELVIGERTSSPASVSGAPTTLSVPMTSGVATNVTWDFGDGNTANSTTPSLSHTYAVAGRYQVTVTASNSISSDQTTFFHRVHAPLLANSAMSSMDMTYEQRATGDHVYIVNPDNDTVSVIDTTTGALLSEVAVGDEPRAVALGDSSQIYIVNKADASISVMDTNALSVTATIDLPTASRPHGLVIDSSTQTAYVALEANGQILKLSLPSGQIQATANVGSTPRELALSADGSTLYAPRFITLPVTGENTRTPAQTGGDFMVVDTASMTLASTIDIVFNAPANNVDTEVNARGIPNYLRAPALSPDGLRAAVPMKLDNIFRGTMRDGQARTHDMLVRGALGQIDLISGTESLSNRFQFDNNSQPTAVAFGPTGNYLFVVHEASRSFEVINAHSNEIIFSDSLGFAPTGIILSPDGDRVFVHNWLDRTVSIIDSSALMAGTSSNADVITTTELVANDVLEERVLAGKKLFHDSSDLRLAAQKYISCAGCHDEAGHDGRTWDFSDAGEGLRNTIDLRGRAGVGNGNVHWSANFNEIHDFENDIREIFDGTGLLSDADFAASSAPLDPDTPKAGRSTSLDALAAYAATLATFGDSPYRTDNGSLTVAGTRGKAVFDNASCASCHGGDHFTDSVQGLTHNVGTVDQDTGGRLGMPLLNGGLDTPTLRGLWHGAPYLHDGEALTLQDAVLAHTTGMSVDPATLSTAQLDDLADYLLQIDDNEPAPATPNEPVDPNNSDAASTQASITIDGNLADWPAAALVANDPSDVTGAQNTLDLQAVWMAHDGNNLFVRYQNYQPNNAVLTWGYGIYIDVDGSEGYTGFNAELPIGIDFMVEGNVLFRYTGTGANWSWEAVRNLSHELVGTNAELAIKRTDLDDATAINVFFSANNESVQGTTRDFLPDAAADPTAAANTRVIAYNFGGTANPNVPPTQSTQAVTNIVTNIVVDGNLSEWNSLTSFGNDPADVFGSTNTIDWREGWMAHSGTDFYIAWENKLPTQKTWGNGIMLDTDLNVTTGFLGFGLELPIGVDYLIEGDSLFRYTGSGTDWLWQLAGTVEFSAAGNNAEMKIPASLIGNPTGMRLFFTGDNASVGGAAIDFYPDTVSDAQLSLLLRSHRYSTTVQPPTQNTEFTPVIDGTLTEWSSDMQVGGDDGVEANSINTIDWHRAFAAHNDTSLFLAYTMHQQITLNWGYSVFIDTDGDISTGFKGFGNELPLGADFLIEAGALYAYNSTGQSEWNWLPNDTLRLNTVGNSLELSIPRAALGNPDSIDFIFSGDNSSVNGNSIDLLPDTGAHNYNLNAPTTQPEAPAQVSLSPLDDPMGDIAMQTTATSLSMDDDGGSGSLTHWTLVWLVMMIGARLSRRVLSFKSKTGLVGFSIVLSALLVGCDSGSVNTTNMNTVGGEQNQQGQGQIQNQQPVAAMQPNNRPSFNVPAELGAALPDSQPNNDASLSIGVQADLSGIEVVPAVATNAGGSVRVSFDTTTGALQGTVQHTANNAVSAAIYRSPVGGNGQLIVTLVSVDDGNYVFDIPEGTMLNSTQQAQFEDNLFYVVVHTIDKPSGELRAQLQTEAISVEYLPTLNDLQAKVFSPRCSTCHIGGGTSLPSSMDLTNAEATYTSLVGRASLEVEGVDRIIPGMASESYVVHKIEGTQPVGSRMPFRGEPLSAEAIAAIREWIDQGSLR